MSRIAMLDVSFEIHNAENVLAGRVKAVVCETEAALNDWFEENGEENFGPRPALPVGLPIGILGEIQIHASQRRKGLGTGALKDCIARFAKHSCTGVVLNAVQQDECEVDLVSWYRRHGFKEVGSSGLGSYMLLEL